MLDTAKEWAQRLLVKYGIMQPMAPEEPPVCIPFSSASYPAYYDNVLQKDVPPRVGYPASLATRSDDYERRRRAEEDEAAAIRRRNADVSNSILPAAAMMYVSQASLFDMGHTSAPTRSEPSSFTPSPSYDSSPSSSCDSGSGGGGCE